MLTSMGKKERLTVVLLLALLYFVSGKLSTVLLGSVELSNIGVFAAEGFSLAFALYFGAWVWPGIFVGQLVLAIHNGFNPFSAVEVAALNSLEAVLAVWVFSRFDFDGRFRRLKDLLLFVLIVMFVLQPFSALGGNLSLLVHAQIDRGSFWESTFAWWFGNTMGQFLLTPFLLTLLYGFEKIRLADYVLYALIYGCFVYIIEMVLGIDNAFLLFGVTLPPAIYTVAHKGLAYGTMMSVVTALISSIALFHGYDAFNTGDIVTDTINYNLYIFAFSAIILTMGVLFEERFAREEILQQKIDEALKANQEHQLLVMRQSRLAQMGEMIAMIAHQWRQPLNNLSLVNQLLVAKYRKGKLDDGTIEYFDKNAKKQIQLMSSTIDDFRNFFQSEEKKVPFLVEDVVQTVLGMTEAIFATHDIAIDYDGTKGLQSHGFPNSLAQALINILNNAKDALADADLGPGEKWIRIRTYRERGRIIIVISDNAGGIPEEIMPHIFDPYFSTKKEKNGTGLGLYMSKMIIEKQMQGRIEVSNDEAGARFEITLKEHDDETL